ncbi:MAG: hypothetical protein AAGF83_19030 [Cyanobacteria bacterium P01_G01_bin.67]
MSYESQLDNQSGKLINPAKLCLLLSIALHLLVLKFGLPSLRFNNDSGRREVSVIELNPEQQSRLPNLYPQLETPDIPALSNLPELDNSEPAAPFAIPPNLIPGIGDSANLPPLIIPPPPNFNLPPLPPVTDITLPPLGDLSALPLPPEINPSDFKVEPIKLPPNIVVTPQQPPEQGKPEAVKPQKPSTSTKPEAEATESEQEPEVKPKPTPQQIAAIKAANSQQRVRNLSQSLTKNEAGTSDEDARKNYIVWLAKVQDVEPDVIEISGIYPRDACIRRLKGSSVFGVVVNAAGEVVALDLIKGAKYPIFNQQASKDLSDRLLENETGKPKPYQVKVNYEYDSEICPSLTLPSLRRKEEPETEKQQPPPQPEPTPEVKPQPTPEAQPQPVPQPQPKPKPQPAAQPKPAPQPAPEPQPAPDPKPTPELKPLPSLRDRLRNVPLPDRKPADLKDIPLPERPNFKN